MEIFALPDPIPNSILELFEAALQRFPFAALTAHRSLLPCELVQIFSDKPRQCRVAIHGNLADSFHQLIGQRKCDIHEPIIRETLIPCNFSLRDSRKPNAFRLLCALCFTSHILLIAQGKFACYCERIKGELKKGALMAESLAVRRAEASNAITRVHEVLDAFAAR